MDEEEAAVEAYEWTGHTPEEWALLSPDQRLDRMMAVNAADEKAPPEEVVQRAQGAYRHPYR
ncbi:hypothetical protein ACIBEJ_34120 [Nonomuraea sp. NPDC050790]|uniref:hypothetical protein n=1 Tax=Nonomuraea sp. NPDC050790 TaxID=3364371 RepID=UPI00378D7C4E